MLTRFRKYFPVSHWVISNVWIVGIVIAAPSALALGAISIHYGLSLLCIWLGMVCFWIDRKHLDYCLFTPLQPLAMILIMSLGVGISMVIIDGGGTVQDGFLKMQLVGLVGFPIFVACYAWVMRDVPPFRFPRARDDPRVKNLERGIVLVAWCCLVLELARVVAGIVSGAADRGEAGDFLVDRPFGWWSVFGIILRTQTLGYICVPLIWRRSREVGRVAVVALVGTTLFLHFAAASRGAVFFPIFIMIVGCFMFLEIRRIKYEVVIGIGMVALAPFVTLMSHYRNTEAFRETNLKNVFEKVASMKQGIQRMAAQGEESGEKFTEAGKAFIGVADAMIYEMTPMEVPHEGWGRMGHAMWVWVPTMFTLGERPILQDGNLISSYYRGYANARSTIGISWGAECYRRWGWIGVPVGLAVYGLIYGTIFRALLRFYLFHNAFWGFVLCGLFFNFFVAWFFHTFLTMIWLWLYDIPKHILFLWGVTLIVRKLGKIPRISGASFLGSRSEGGEEAGVVKGLWRHIPASNWRGWLRNRSSRRIGN